MLGYTWRVRIALYHGNWSEYVWLDTDEKTARWYKNHGYKVEEIKGKPIIE